MRLLGKEISKTALLETLEERLMARGLWKSSAPSQETALVEPRVDPVSFNVHALETHADATQPLPLHSHRHGLGRVVVWAKWAFRQTCQVFINETLARQRLFNGHVRDSYAQMAAEIMRLRKDVEALKAEKAGEPPPQSKEASSVPKRKNTSPRAK